MKHHIRAAVLCGAFLGAAAAVFAGGDWENDGSRISGSGFVKTEVRAVSSFNGIELEGSGTVILHQGIMRSVSVETDDNVLRVVKTEVVGGVLHLGFERGVRVVNMTRLVFRITAPEVNAITISGSGDVRADTPLRTGSLSLDIRGSGNINAEINVDDLRAGIDGSGDVSVRGVAHHLAVQIDGSGNMRAPELFSDTAEVRVNGSGNVDVNASETITIAIDGSGDVVYGGDAWATIRSSGSGTVRQR